MNREDKRKFIKQFKEKGYSKKEIDQMVMLKEMMDNKKNLQKGQKVKLNLERIMSHPDYHNHTEKYRSWVESHIDVIFTVEYDKAHTDKPTLVCLKEDDSKPKWLFWEGDLEVIDR